MEQGEFKGNRGFRQPESRFAGRGLRLTKRPLSAK
jgi:hypothetical protein